MRAELSDYLKTISNDIATAFPSILVLYLFGSHAAGTAGAESDVDIAVFTDGSEDVLMDLELGVFLQQRLNRPVEVVMMRTASAVLKYEVLRCKMRIFEKDPRLRAVLEVKAVREFFDARHYQAKRSHGRQ